jgi:hypothetical protein
MLDVRDVARGVTPSGEGFWVAGTPTAVSYPSDGNDVCFGLEDASFWFRHRNALILEAMRKHPPRNGAVLDIGGGNGFVSRAMQEAGFDAMLIEPNVAGARNAVQRGVRSVICGAVEAIGLQAAAVGGIALLDVIEHLEDDVGFLTGMAAHFQPGTRIYVTVPAFAALWSGDDAAAGHFRRYRRSAIENVLRSAGFGIDYSTYFFSLLPLPILLFRVLPSRIGIRRAPTRQQLAAEHGSGAGTLVERALKWELSAVRKGRLVPTGSSCLVVGTLRR